MSFLKIIRGAIPANPVFPNHNRVNCKRDEMRKQFSCQLKENLYAQKRACPDLTGESALKFSQ